MSKLALTIATLSAIATARAHSVSLSSGTLEIRADEIRVTLEVPGDDLLHTFRPTPDAIDRIGGDVFAEMAANFAKPLLRDVLLRPDDGEPLAGEIIATRHDVRPDAMHALDDLRRARVRYELRYGLSRPPRVLTLQQLLFTDGASHASALALAIRGPDGEAATTVQLTNRGNTETLDIEWPDAAPAVPPRTAAALPAVVAEAIAAAPAPATIRIPLSDRFKTVQSTVNITDAEVRIAIAVPLLLYETWQPIPRADRNFLSVAERAAAYPTIERFFRTHNPLQLDGQPVAPDALTIQVLGPLDYPDGSCPTSRDRHSAYTARILATLHYPTHAQPANLRLTWDMFNSAVLDAQVTLSEAQQKTHHCLTTYDPCLTWSRNASPANR